MIYRKVKRVLDTLLALIILIVLLPIFLIVAIAVKVSSKGPVLFKQTRVGRSRRTFTIYKFRTMLTEAPKDCPPYMFDNPDIYITKVGNFLRKSSIDELPQVLNVLKGEMSFIGPRPATPKEEELNQLRDVYGVFTVRPGITGWAQINGRDEMYIDRKAKLDGEYVQKMSFLFDMKIFFLTIVKVFKREGIMEGKYEGDNASVSSQTEKNGK